MAKLGFTEFLSGDHEGYIITSFFFPKDPHFNFVEFYTLLAKKGMDKCDASFNFCAWRVACVEVAVHPDNVNVAFGFPFSVQRAEYIKTIISSLKVHSAFD